jgi:hypothetical protein
MTSIIDQRELMIRYRLVKTAIWISVSILAAAALALGVVVVTAVGLVIRDFWNMI